MSLKAFHVFFISVSVLLCVGFGVWCFARQEIPSATWLGLGSIVVGAALVVYEVNFLRKYRETQ